MEAYDEAIVTCCDVKNANLDVYGIMINEVKLLSLYMEYE